jgi:adenylyltransferase/sulfurtransferase
VGKIGLVDFDTVDFTNLQRQIIHTTPDVGAPKLKSATQKLNAINPHVAVETHETRLTSENALQILERYDIVIDGTDNFPTRYLVNDACVLLKKPNVYGSIFRFDGQASLLAHEDGPCYRCLFPEPPPPGTVPSCAEGGVFGVLPGVIGTIQATEAIKLIIGKGETLKGRLLLYDALNMRVKEVRIKRDPECPVCGDDPSIKKLIDYESFCGIQQATFKNELSAKDLEEKLSEVQLIDVREPHEYEINRIPGSVLIPLGELPARVNQLDQTKPIVAYCLSGSRSAQACEFLVSAGFNKVQNLTGGIRAWIEEVDPNQPRY